MQIVPRIFRTRRSAWINVHIEHTALLSFPWFASETRIVSRLHTWYEHRTSLDIWKAITRIVAPPCYVSMPLPISEEGLCAERLTIANFSYLSLTSQCRMSCNSLDKNCQSLPWLVLPTIPRSKATGIAWQCSEVPPWFNFCLQLVLEWANAWCCNLNIWADYTKPCDLTFIAVRWTLQ